MKKVLSSIILIMTAMLLCCGCDYSSSGSTSVTTQTEAPKEVLCQITVNYDESLGEYLFGNSEVFYISLDGEDIGSVSSSSNSKPIVKELYLTEGYHTVTAKSSKDKLFDFNTVSFKVKATEGLYTAEFEMDKGNLELVQTHIYEEPKNNMPQEGEETVSINEEDYVYLNLYVCFGLSTIPDLFTDEYQSFTVYLDGEELKTLERDDSLIDRDMYFEKGIHKLSIRKNNTDDFDYDSLTFTVKDTTTRLSFFISHNQLLDTYKLEVRE
ncbi:MAG: hypothetical protein ACI4J0_02615 [Huintestinicola sp.]|uniref:hypothetical protein n=1 Tax=Huintestinicola sp. TaxID=2981661 RepID=UPI003F1214A2